MKAVFQLNNIEQLERLQQTIKALPVIAEKEINEYLHNDASKYSIEQIKIEMPTSKPKNKNSKGQPKSYAKESDSLKSTNINLGFIISTTSKFYYLKFPALGVGNSYKNNPNDFMNRGINKVIPKIANNLQEKLINKMKEELK